jgi:hypothetical protein
MGYFLATACQFHFTLHEKRSRSWEVVSMYTQQAEKNLRECQIYSIDINNLTRLQKIRLTISISVWICTNIDKNLHEKNRIQTMVQSNPLQCLSFESRTKLLRSHGPGGGYTSVLIVIVSCSIFWIQARTTRKLSQIAITTWWAGSWRWSEELRIWESTVK